MLTWLKRLALLVAAVAIVGAIVYALRPQPVPVDVATVERGTLTETVDEEGIARIREVYAVSAPFAGRVARSPLEVGDTIIANRTLVATMHPADPPFIDARSRRELEAAAAAARSAVRLAEAEVRQAEAELAQAQSDLERAERLFSTRTVSEQRLEQARTEVATREAQVRRAEASLGLRQSELASAEARLIQPGEAATGGDDAACCVSLRSPASGVVLAVPVESEQVVQAGTRLAEIGDPDDLEVVVDLLSSDAVRVRPGSRAIITDWGGGTDLEATVRRVDPAGFTEVSALGIEEQRVNALLDLVGADTERLGHNYRVFVRIVVWEGDDVVKLPLGALFRSANRWSAFVVEDGTARRRVLDIGHRDAAFAEVLSGVAAGDEAILYPSDAVADGVKVVKRGTEEQ